MATKNHERLRQLLHPDVDFRGMTPGGLRESGSADGVLAVFGDWFDDNDDVEGIDQVERDAFADVERVGYRFRVRNPDGLHLVEQQAYYESADDRITWLRVICAGYRAIPG